MTSTSGDSMLADLVNTSQDLVSRTATLESDSKDLESCKSLPTKSSWLTRWSWGRRTETQSTVGGVHMEKEPAADLDDWITITRSLDGESPDGYHRVATFQSSDSSFALFRSFAYARCRVLCAWQYKISRLEQQLDMLDNWDNGAAGDKLKLSSQERDEAISNRQKEEGLLPLHLPKKTRSEILADLRSTMIEYDEMLLKTREIMALPKPSKRDYNSVRHFFTNLQPIVREEADYMRRKEDLITLRCGREYAGFDTLIEGTLSRIDKCLRRAPFRSKVIQRMFLTPELRAKTSNPEIHYYAPHRVQRLVNVVIALIIFVIMIVPVFVMYCLSESNENPGGPRPFEAIGILVISTMLFGAAMSALTKAKRAELFAASAAYCAVLVVFITNFSSQAVSVIGPVTIGGT